jgi:hypothetical protein
MVYNRFFLGFAVFGLIATGAFIHSVNATTQMTSLPSPSQIEHVSHPFIFPVKQSKFDFLPEDASSNPIHWSAWNNQQQTLVNDSIDYTWNEIKHISNHLFEDHLTPQAAELNVDGLSSSSNKKAVSKPELKKMKAADHYALLNE